MAVSASRAFLVLAMLAIATPLAAQQQDEERNLTELRNTVVNLLQALVDRGIITREQADAMVKSAQEKAAAQAAAAAEQQKAEAGAVRVPYVPEIVKDEIKKEVVADLAPSVKQEVAQQVGAGGALFSSLPDWVQRMTWTGDVRIRGEADVFGQSNAQDTYLDFNQVNSAGGIDKAGTSAFLNTIQDQDRLRVRARFGFDEDLGSGFSTSMRVATGTTGEIVATNNQTLGTYEAAYQIALSQAYLRWAEGAAQDSRQLFSITAGRFGNPWVSTDLIWYNDLDFEGVVSNYHVNLSDDNQHRHDVFMTIGALPLSSFSLTNSNPTGEQKWLLAGQLGVDFTTDDDSRLRLAGAYYDYVHIVGERNAPGSTLYNWTAPTFVQKGNTMFDISNSTDPTVNLFALASNFRIVDLTAVEDIRVFDTHSVGVTLEALRNFGFNTAEVEARTGTYVAPRTRGWRGDLSYGTAEFGPFATWRLSAGYRYLERDAVLDAFNDEDFHLGGTDAKGYTLMFDWSINPHVWLRLKGMAADAIDGPPLAIDVWELDVNGHF